MLQTQEYNGYLQDGRFISTDTVAPPDNVKVVVKVIGQVLPFKSADEKFSAEQQEVLDILDSIREINKEGFDEETLESFAMWDRGEFKLDWREKSL